MDCIFCKIIAGEIPSHKILETDQVIAFHDIHPEAPVHALVLPKAHIAGIQDLTGETMPIVMKIHEAIQEVSELTGIAKTGYRVISNCGSEAGQTVFHLHYHVLGGAVLGVKLL